MTEIAEQAAEASAGPALPSRLAGVIFSPRDTYAAVAARPRAWGALLLVAGAMGLAQFAFLSTGLGQDLALEQQARSMEAFGMTITDEAYERMAQGMPYARYTSAASILVFVPIMNAIVAGLLLVVFTMILGGAGTFRQLFAILAHAGVIPLLQQLFGLPLTYASGEVSGANLGVFVPMLDERSVAVLFLSSIDLFLLWWCIGIAIGLGVLYKRRTGPIAVGLISLYVLIALVIALIRT